MKKIVLWIIIILLSIQMFVYANSDTMLTNEQINAINNLEALGIISKKADKYSNATRGECIVIMANLLTAAKLPGNTDDKINAAVEYTVLMGFLKGRINKEGQITLEVDKEITLGEVVIFCGRLICDGQMFDDLYADKLMNGDNEWLVNYAKENRFFGIGDSYTQENIDKPITYAQMCVIMERVLHLPVTVDTAYGGPYTKYYIDDFIG